MVNATPPKVEDWPRRAPDDSRDRRDRHCALFDEVHQRGYSVPAAATDLLQRHQAALSAFEQSDRLPRNERAVRQATSELTGLFCPDLIPGERYDLASIVALLTCAADLPPMALRMTGLPRGADGTARR